MKKLFGLAVLSLALVAAPSLSAAGPHDQPGIPGAKNCHGQTAAYLAQLSKNGLFLEGFRGIGGVASGGDITVQDVQAGIDQYCASGV